MKSSTLCVTLTTVLCLVGLSCGQQTCYGNVCLSCPDCSIFLPSYSSIGDSVPTVADLKRSCTCAGCADIFNTECIATDKISGKAVPDSTPVPAGNGISMGDITSSESSSSGVFYECPVGCRSISYSPVIFGSEISVKEILRGGCTCTGCPGAAFPKCKLYKDGVELGPDDVLSGSEAASAQRIDNSGGSATEDVFSSTTDSQSPVKVMVAIVCSILCSILMLF